MTFVTYALLILWWPACLTALFFLFRPSRRWPVFGTRLRAFLMLIAFTFGIPVFAVLIAPESMRAKPGEENKSTLVAASTIGPESAPTTAAAAKTDAANDSADADPKRYLELSGVKTARTAQGTVLLSGEIFNGAEQAVKNPRLKCYLSKDRQDAGTVSAVVRKTIPSSQEITVSIDMGKASGAWNHEACEIVAAEAASRKG